MLQNLGRNIKRVICVRIYIWLAEYDDAEEEKILCFHRLLPLLPESEPGMREGTTTVRGTPQVRTVGEIVG